MAKTKRIAFMEFDMLVLEGSGNGDSSRAQGLVEPSSEQVKAGQSTIFQIAILEFH